MRATTLTTLALATLTPLASARRFLVLWEHISSLAGQNDYPFWRIDTGNIDLCATAEDWEWGDSEMTGSSYFYESEPWYSRIIGKEEHGIPTVDIYKGDDGVHRPYLAGGDGSEIGTCSWDNMAWRCLDNQAGGSVGRKVVLVCDLNA